MKVNAQGVLETSNIYFHTPSEMARKMFFYPVCTGHYFCDRTYIVNRRSYNSFLVLLVLKGRGYVEQGGRRIPLSEGSLALVDCYRDHCYGSEHGWEIVWCHFDGVLARTYYESIAANSKCVISLPDPHTAERSLDKIYSMFHDAKKASEASISKHLTAVLTEFLLAEDASAGDSQESGATERILAYITENVSQPLTLEHLAQKAALSPFYFTRVFKKETGYTPHEYLIHARVNAAKYYLKTSDMPVKEVSIHCGFASECTFCTTFKKLVGTTPLLYRRHEGPSA
jgi:AraC-like DNA-binding protein